MCNDSSSPYRICKVEGCNKLGGHTGNYRKDGSLIRRSLCQKHADEYYASREGKTVTDWKNSFHEYRKYRKKYCENIDGRLGFTCTANIIWIGMLQVDHKDRNHKNNNPENLQTLCANCHAYKTNINKDWLNDPLPFKPQQKLEKPQWEQPQDSAKVNSQPKLPEQGELELRV
jgi:hypothetical protein